MRHTSLQSLNFRMYVYSILPPFVVQFNFSLLNLWRFWVSCSEM